MQNFISVAFTIRKEKIGAVNPALRVRPIQPGLAVPRIATEEIKLPICSNLMKQIAFSVQKPLSHTFNGDLGEESRKQMGIRLCAGGGGKRCDG